MGSGLLVAGFYVGMATGVAEDLLVLGFAGLYGVQGRVLLLGEFRAPCMAGFGGFKV